MAAVAIPGIAVMPARGEYLQLSTYYRRLKRSRCIPIFGSEWSVMDRTDSCPNWRRGCGRTGQQSEWDQTLRCCDLLHCFQLTFRELILKTTNAGADLLKDILSSIRGWIVSEFDSDLFRAARRNCAIQLFDRNFCLVLLVKSHKSYSFRKT